MVVPIFGTWEMSKDNVLFASMVTVATPCWGFGTQHGLISSRFSLYHCLLIKVPHGPVFIFLGVGEELIFMRKYF